MVNEFIAGETIPLEFQFLQENGEPLNISLFSTFFKMCYLGDKSYEIISKEGELSSPFEGKFSVVLSPEETQDFTEGYYTFQAGIYQVGGHRQIMENTLFIRGAI